MNMEKLAACCTTYSYEFTQIIAALGKTLEGKEVVRLFDLRCKSRPTLRSSYYELDEILTIRTHCILSPIDDAYLLERQRKCEALEKLYKEQFREEVMGSRH